MPYFLNVWPEGNGMGLGLGKRLALLRQPHKLVCRILIVQQLSRSEVGVTAEYERTRSAGKLDPRVISARRQSRPAGEVGPRIYRPSKILTEIQNGSENKVWVECTLWVPTFVTHPGGADVYPRSSL